MTTPEWGVADGSGRFGVRYKSSITSLIWVAAVAVLLIGLGTPLVRWDSPSVVQTDLLAMSAAFAVISGALIWGAIALRRTPVLRFDDQGIHRGPIGPRMTIPWADIDRIWMGPRGVVVLRTPSGRVARGGRRTWSKTYYLSYRTLEGDLAVAQFIVDEWQRRTGRAVG